MSRCRLTSLHHGQNAMLQDLRKYELRVKTRVVYQSGAIKSIL